jgi:hypothetical protein
MKPKPLVNKDKIAQALGAERRGEVRAAGGYFGAVQLLYDVEQMRLGADPEFWRMIEARRRERTIPDAQVREELGLPPRRRRRR